MAKAFVGCVLTGISDLFSSEAKKRSDKIDKQIAEEKDKFLFSTFENLIMGVRRSGKSTFFQHLKKLYIDGGSFSEETRKKRKNDIRKYLADSIADMLSATKLPLTTLKNLAVAKWLEHNLKKSSFKCFDNYEHLPKIFFNLSTFFNFLWEDKTIKQHLQTYGELYLKDNVEYFIDQIDVVFKDNYLPTDEDVLRCPVFSANMDELHIDFSSYGPNKYIFIDTGHDNKQLSKLLPWKKTGDRKKRLRKIPGTARYLIVFLVDCSSSEQLSSSLTMFENLVFSSDSFCIMIYVVLNKLDILKKHIFSGKTLETFFIDFPDFPDFVTSFNNNFGPRNHWEQEEDRRVVMAVKFIIQKIQIHRDVYYLYSTRKCVLQTFSGILDERDVKGLVHECVWHNQGILTGNRFY